MKLRVIINSKARVQEAQFGSVQINFKHNSMVNAKRTFKYSQYFSSFNCTPISCFGQKQCSPAIITDDVIKYHPLILQKSSKCKFITSLAQSDYETDTKSLSFNSHTQQNFSDELEILDLKLKVWEENQRALNLAVNSIESISNKKIVCSTALNVCAKYIDAWH